MTSSPSRDQWMSEALLEQEIYSSLLGNRDYDTFAATETRNLRKKIAFAMFDKPPRLEPGVETLEPISKTQRRRLDKICAMIRKEKGAESDYRVAFLFVLYATKTKRGFGCVVRIPSGDQSERGYKFVDDTPRTYATWSDYLANNRLPKCVMCFPVDGVYKEGCEFRFAKSPACKVVKDIGRGLYGASLALGAGAGVVTTAAMFVPVTIPVMAVAIATSVASGAYVAGRSISGLRDRGNHGQTLALRSTEARTHWFGIVSFLFDSAAATTSVLRSAAVVARSKRVVGVASQLGNAVKLSAQTVKALRVANFIAGVVKRLGNRSPLTRVDLIYLVDAIYFFCNVVLALEDVGFLVGLTNSDEVGVEFDIFEELFDRHEHVTQVEKQQIGIILSILGQYEPDGLTDVIESTHL